MQVLGNAKVNDLMEGSPAASMQKPGPQASRSDKDDYIRLKYIQKAFLKKEVLMECGSKQEREQALLKAAAANDLDTIMVLHSPSPPPPSPRTCRRGTK